MTRMTEKPHLAIPAFVLAIVAMLLMVAIVIAPAARAEAPAKGKVPPFWIWSVTSITQHLYDGDLAEPRGVFVDRARGEVWVADTRNNLIGLFSPDGVPLFATAAGGHLSEPSKIAVGPDGKLYILDNDRSKIKVLSYRGEWLGTLDLPGVPKAPVFGAITFDEEGNLWVGENSECRVLSFGRDLKPKGRFGTCGSGEGEFQSIAGIALDKERVYVIDHQVTPVQVFDRRGSFIRGWGKHDMGAQNFSLPEGIALDSKGRVVVVDALRHEIKFFETEGNFLSRFGGLGDRPGQVAFPADVAIDAADRLYVAEKGNSRVQLFAEGEAAAPGTSRQP